MSPPDGPRSLYPQVQRGSTALAEVSATRAIPLPVALDSLQGCKIIAGGKAAAPPPDRRHPTTTAACKAATRIAPAPGKHKPPNLLASSRTAPFSPGWGRRT